MSDFYSSIERKSMMYEMLLAIENDFIDNIFEKLVIDDIPKSVIARSNKSSNTNYYLSILQGIDIQSYIEICNSNIAKLNFSVDEKQFLNLDLSKIIQIRNNVMHPRPLGALDFYLVKGIFDQIDTILTSFYWNNVVKIRRKIKES